MPARRNPPPHRYIYVIGPTAGLQKVGLATDPKTRLAALQTACPFHLLLHASVQVPFGEAHAVERRAHRALARYRSTGEWFEVTPADAVAAAQAAAGAVATVSRMPLFEFGRQPGLAGAPSPIEKKGRVTSMARVLWKACRTKHFGAPLALGRHK